MELNEIKEKSISGAKWAIILTAISLPLGYGTNIVLGRISPEALGTYGIIIIFVSIVITFILFGGNTALVKYLPEVGNSRQVSLIIGYLALSFIIAVPFMLGLYFCPQVINFLLKKGIEANLLTHLFLLIPVIILQQIIMFSLNGLMEIKLSVLSQRILSFGNFCIFSLIFLFFKNFFTGNYQSIILITYSGLLFSTTVIALFFLIKRLQELKTKWKVRPYFPKGFWRFALFVHASTLLSFAYNNTDQLLLLGYLSISQLGLYLAVLRTAMFIRLIPQILGQVMLPTFSNLLAMNEIKIIQKGYNMITKYNVLVSVPIALVCIFFPHQILALFGSKFEGSYGVLVVLAFFFGLGTMGQVNASLIVARGKSGLHFLNSSIQIGFQIAASLLLVQKFGSFGVAIAKGGSLLFAQIGLILIVFSVLNLNLKIPRSYYAGIITIMAAGLLYWFFHTQSFACASALFLLCITFLIIGGGYSRRDFEFILANMIPKSNFAKNFSDGN